MKEISDLKDDTDEIYASGLIKRYTKRPVKFDNLSLADWAAWYDSSGTLYIKPSNELDIDNYLLETNLGIINDDVNEKNESEPKNKKRSKVRIFRSVCYNKEVDLALP